MEYKDKYTKEEAEKITNDSFNKIKLIFGQNVFVQLVDRSVVVFSRDNIQKVFNFDGSRNINKSLKAMEAISL